jgi:predicted metal-dependent enzyme (double-stranded beta helix superfamily)
MSSYDRREIMNLSLASFLGLAAKLPALAEQAHRAAAVSGLAPFRPHLNWDALIGYIDKAARMQYEAAWDQNQYANRIEAFAKALNLLDTALLERLNAAHTRAGRVPAIEDLERRLSFQISLITFEPGQVLPLHDHPRMTGVMTCATGIVDVRRFHMLSTDSRGASCTLRDEGLIRMVPGVVSSLTENAHNIHGLRAQTFSQIIDIFTPPYDSKRIQESREFRLTDYSSDGADITATILTKLPSLGDNK